MTELADRLARFRALRQAGPSRDHGVRDAPSGGRPGGRTERPGIRGIDAHAREWSERLAATVGGCVETTPAGSVVRVTSRVRLPLDVARLAALPYTIEPDRPILCLDTETTGLGTAAGTLAFLVGIGRWEGDMFIVDQLLVPDHSEEVAFLGILRDALSPDAWLVTYNGRGFDWPLLVTRFRLHRMPEPPHRGHLDLLPIARQLWRHRTGDARLSSVEAGVAGVRRSGDLPGALIPERYLGFLRDGDAAPLRAVLAHNREDVVSLARLLVHLADHLADPAARRHEPPGDVAGLARAFAQRRRFDEALACCADARGAASDPREHDQLRSYEARVLRMAGRREAAAAAWYELAVRGGPLAAVAWVQLAKHHEHVRRDPIAALDAVDRAASLAARGRLLGRDLPRLERDLARRRARLRRRIARRRLTRVPATPVAPPGAGRPAAHPSPAPRS